MQKRKLFAFATALSLLASAVAGIHAAAFGGTYPEHSTANSGFTNGGGNGEKTNKQEWTPSNEDYLFYVDGRPFVLLDTDEEGNYFIFADECYGKYAYTTAYANGEAWEMRDGGNYIPGPVQEFDHSKWMFNTTDEKNIGYWLNHDFLENGNGGRKLPQTIKDHLVEKDWGVEGLKAIVDWTVNSYYDAERGRLAAQALTQDNGFSTSGKVALMSYTEFKKYSDIIGFATESASTWDGFMLRTPSIWLQSSSGSNKIACKIGSLQVKNEHAKTAAATSGRTVIYMNDSGDRANFFVRPAMFLDKEFFNTVALDLSTTGSAVKEAIKENGVAELSEIYTDEQLEQLGFNLANLPVSEHQAVVGTPVEGALLYADYAYASAASVAEGDSVIDWYIADAADGEFTPLGISGKNITVDAAMVGKYLKCRIMPADANGNRGKYFWSTPSAAIADMQIPAVKDAQVDGSTVSITVKNTAAQERGISIVKAVFDAEGQLTAVENTDPIAIQAGGETTQAVDVSEQAAGRRITIMVWMEGTQPVFYMEL